MPKPTMSAVIALAALLPAALVPCAPAQVIRVDSLANGSVLTTLDFPITGPIDLGVVPPQTDQINIRVYWPAHTLDTTDIPAVSLDPGPRTVPLRVQLKDTDIGGTNFAEQPLGSIAAAGRDFAGLVLPIGAAPAVRFNCGLFGAITGPIHVRNIVRLQAARIDAPITCELPETPQSKALGAVVADETGVDGDIICNGDIGPIFLVSRHAGAGGLGDIIANGGAIEFIRTGSLPLGLPLPFPPVTITATNGIGFIDAGVINANVTVDGPGARINYIRADGGLHGSFIITQLIDNNPDDLTWVLTAADTSTASIHAGVIEGHIALTGGIGEIVTQGAFTGSLASSGRIERLQLGAWIPGSSGWGAGHGTIMSIAAPSAGTVDIGECGVPYAEATPLDIGTIDTLHVETMHAPLGSGAFPVNVGAATFGAIGQTQEDACDINIAAFDSLTIDDLGPSANLWLTSIPTDRTVRIRRNLQGRIQVSEPEGLQGQVVVNADGCCQGWSPAAQVAVRTQDLSFVTLPRHYATLPASLGGGAIGPVPFTVHTAQSNALNNGNPTGAPTDPLVVSRWNAPLDACGLSPQHAAIEFDGPIALLPPAADSVAPVSVQYRAVTPGSPEPTWVEASANLSFTIDPANARRLLMKPTPGFTYAPGIYRVQTWNSAADRLICAPDALLTPAPVPVDPMSVSTGTAYSFTVFSDCAPIDCHADNSSDPYTILSCGYPDTAFLCDSIDWNGDGLFPDTQDIADFLTVFGGGPCPTGTCHDIDINNDALFPDTLDIAALLSIFGGGPCLF